MKKIIFILSFLFICSAAFADVLDDWADFETSLRKGGISAAEAEHQAKKNVPKLAKFTEDKNISENKNWVFPVSGFSKTNVKNIKKLISAMSDNVRETKFLDGLEFLVQPYLRLEIKYSKEQIKERGKNVSADDKNKKEEADVLAANNAIVIYVKTGALNSAGGNAVWLYNPSQNFFIYYGILRTVDVKAGDIVSAGDKIGTIRPVKKGYELNFAVLMYGDDEFTLFNYFEEML
ncbi:MAG: M23 family metallopeptidase [Endomicrobium sp.]|jgi:hypothetical protein|nr:M23 family metallopeptidase [Endomicrobium sp.]